MKVLVASFVLFTCCTAAGPAACAANDLAVRDCKQALTDMQKAVDHPVRPSPGIDYRIGQEALLKLNGQGGQAEAIESFNRLASLDDKARHYEEHKAQDLIFEYVECGGSISDTPAYLRFEAGAEFMLTVRNYQSQFGKDLVPPPKAP